MSDVVGRGVIEISANAPKLKAGIDDAKRSIGGLGDAAEKIKARSSKPIDNDVKSFQTQNTTQGTSRLDAGRC